MEYAFIWGYNDNAVLCNFLEDNMSISISESPYYGAGSITREQFLFSEMKRCVIIKKEYSKYFYFFQGYIPIYKMYKYITIRMRGAI